MRNTDLTTFLICLMVPFSISAQIDTIDTAITSLLTYRNVGPTRGGRVTTVAAHADLPGVFYAGSTGGGLWKSTSYGHSWKNISDGYFDTGSIGALAVAPSNPDIIYAGTGSDGLRSNVIIGKGVYKSLDGGKTWDHAGLRDAGQIGAVIIHPGDSDIVMVAAIGNPFIDNPERGVFRTTDGGKTWSKPLYISDNTGAVDLEFAPGDPDIVYASMWEARRKPWNIISGGLEGGVYKSIDGGKNWKKLTTGLPSGTIGKSDLAVSPNKPDRVWLLVEAPDTLGGVYLSDDKGETFKQVSHKKQLLDRPFYYCNIDANPKNGNSIYVSATQFWHSKNSGLDWDRINTPHSDNHDLWINPVDTNEWLQASDGGVSVTRDGGSTWSSIENQSTAELYQVAVDDQTPYWLYAGQQDNTTIAVPSLPPSAPTSDYRSFWTVVGGCETGPAIPKPGNHNIVYANCKGRFGVYNKLTGQEKQYYVGAGNMYGHNPRDLKFRFQRVAPIHISPHDPDVVYHGSQYLHKTMDDGQTWEIISPDLTAFTPETQVFSGTPITRDITGEEFFSTIYAVQESPVEAGVIWVGANDGPIHVTKDGGKSWENVTPEILPYGRVQTIEPSPHDPAKAYAAIYRYLLGDFKPYIFKTTDYGQSWSLLTDGGNGIPADFPTRVVREDPSSPGLLFAGTEFGMFMSVNDGKTWEKFQQNLPVTPITDIKVHQNDLVISTMGRGFWIVDDISILQQLAPEGETTTIYSSKQTIRYRYRGTSHDEIPSYPTPGINIYYYLDQEPQSEVVIGIYDTQGKLVQSYSSAQKAEGVDKKPDMATGFGYRTSDVSISQKTGGHVLRWNFRHRGIRSRSDRPVPGPFVAPGRYRIDMVVDSKTFVSQIEIKPDPRVLKEGTTIEDLRTQEELCLDLQKRIVESQQLARSVEQVLKEGKNDEAEYIKSQLVTAEGRYQQPMLLDQLSYLYSMMTRADQLPGKDAVMRYDELVSILSTLREKAEENSLLD